MIYSCELVEIIKQLGETKARIALGLTMYYVVYAIAQVWLSAVIDKIHLGTVLAYGISALFVSFGLWQYTFLLFGLFLFVTIICYAVVIWRAQRQLPAIETVSANESKARKNKPTNHLGIYIMICCISMLFSNLVYYTVTNWFPNFLNEVFGVSGNYSILISIVLPILIMFSPMIAMAQIQKKHKKVWHICFEFALFALLLAGIMISTNDVNIILSIAMIVGIVFFIRGFTNVVNTYLPLQMTHIMNSGTTSLIFNAASCVGAAIAPVLSGYIVDTFGWDYFFVTIAVACIAILVIVFLAKKYQKKILDI